MTTATLAPISASAISRILKTAGVKKSLSARYGYSTGFECIGLGTVVQVHYTPRQIDNQADELERIVRIVNSRPKYEAKVVEGTVSGVVEVRLREESPEAEKEDRVEDRVEELAEESPHAVTVKEVRAVLGQSRRFYEFTSLGGGFFVDRPDAPANHLVRVVYRDHPHTGYGLVVGGRDGYAHQAVQNYAQVLVEAGYSVCIDYQDGVESLLVGPAGSFGSQEDAAEAAKEPLMALRAAVESDMTGSYYTRMAPGGLSIFVLRLASSMDKVRRCEVFWSEGSYRVHLGGAHIQRAVSAERVVGLLRDELDG